MQSHVAGVIARLRILLERRIMLFVDNDQAQSWHGSKDSAARADHHGCVAGGNTAPLMVTFYGTHMAVQAGDVAKTLGEAMTRLRCEADFGYQHDRATSVRDHFVDGLHVDFGFAAAGDSVQQDRFLLASSQGAENLAHGLSLIDAEGERNSLRRRGCGGEVLDYAFGASFDELSVAQESQRGRRAIGGCAKLIASQWTTFGDQGHAQFVAVWSTVCPAAPNRVPYRSDTA